MKKSVSAIIRILAIVAILILLNAEMVGVSYTYTSNDYSGDEYSADYSYEYARYGFMDCLTTSSGRDEVMFFTCLALLISLIFLLIVGASKPVAGFISSLISTVSIIVFNVAVEDASFGYLFGKISTSEKTFISSSGYMRDSFVAVVICVIIITIICTVTFVKRNKSAENAPKLKKSVPTAVSYEIKKSAANTETYEETETASIPRCAVCETILLDGSTVCPNCGTAVPESFARRHTPEPEPRKLEFSVTHEEPIRKEKNVEKTDTSSHKASGPVMIGSLKSTMRSGSSSGRDSGDE